MAVKMTAGTRLGPYEIVDWLGAGGMGDVYRARDPRLSRDVAIKLIAPSLAIHPDRLNRFEQEARVAGQLNHPNVLAVYDVGSHDGTPYIVSELLDGETLRSRLQKGALPARKAIEYVRQAAEGLAAAHEKNIVHRDIKPDNLFVTTDDRVKILDFGIGKLTQPANETIERSQTETAEGVVLGTPGYMSPEQLRGERVDARSDLFSLGVVLFQALAGRAPFERPTPAETVAAVLKDEPAGLQSPAVSPALARIVARCLEKSSEMRYQSARDLAFGLAGIFDESGTGALASRSSSSNVLRWAPWILAAALAVGLAMALLRTPPPAELMELDPSRIALGAEALIPPRIMQFGDSAVLSPDERAIVFVAQREPDGPPQLYYRELFAELSARPLPFTTDAIAPFFSPDSKWVGFFAEGELKKVAVTGGHAVTLAKSANPRGGAWNTDDTIVFSDRVAKTRLLRVSSAADNAEPEPVTTLDEGEVIHAWPQELTDGRILYTASRSRGNFNEASLVVQKVPNGERTTILNGGYHGRFIPTSPGSNTGYLLYVHDDALMAVGFDLLQLKKTGVPVPVVKGLLASNATGGAQFSVALSGALAYQPSITGPGSPIHLLDATGLSKPIMPQPAHWWYPVFSSDVARVRIAMEIRKGTSNISVFEEATGRLTALTTDSMEAHKPVWSPKARYIAFAAQRDGKAQNLWLMNDTGGSLRPLTKSPYAQSPGSWSPDGRHLVFEEERTGTDSDLMVLRMEGSDATGWTEAETQAFLSGPTSDHEPRFSPNGNWIMYERREENSSNIWVSPFPASRPAVQVSMNGGANAVWSPTSNEIFYRLRTGELMVVTYTESNGSFQPGEARIWSEGRFLRRGINRMFDIHPDGRRFGVGPEEPARPDQITLFRHFLDELRRRVPTGNK